MTSTNTRLDAFHEKYGMPLRRDMLEGLTIKERKFVESQIKTLYWMSNYAKVQSQGLLYRISLMTEELAEFLEAILAGDRPNVAKEGGDLMVTVIGTLAQMGIDADNAFEKVMDSNMTKPEGYSLINREKGEGYAKPDFTDA